MSLLCSILDGTHMRRLLTLLSSLIGTYQVSALSIDTPVDFSKDGLGLYQKTDFMRDWGLNPPSSSGIGSRLTILADPDNADHHVLQVTYLANQIGGQSAMTFSAPLGGQYDHLFFQYRVRFAEDFTWVKGGKLPGLTSAPDSPTGCIDNTTFDGFSARYMWREDGLLWGYIYNPTKQERCGDYYHTEPSFYFQKNQWYVLKQEVFLGTPAKDDGYIKAWVNGGLVTNIPNIMLRKSENIHIDQVKMDTFFGGGSSDWAPSSDQHAYFSDFIISEAPL